MNQRWLTVTRTKDEQGNMDLVIPTEMMDEAGLQEGDIISLEIYPLRLGLSVAAEVRDSIAPQVNRQ